MIETSTELRQKMSEFISSKHLRDGLKLTCEVCPSPMNGYMTALAMRLRVGDFDRTVMWDPMPGELEFYTFEGMLAKMYDRVTTDSRFNTVAEK